LLQLAADDPLLLHTAQHPAMFDSACAEPVLLDVLGLPSTVRLLLWMYLLLLVCVVQSVCADSCSLLLPLLLLKLAMTDSFAAAAAAAASGQGGA
jgi:hypothetical protein